MSITAGIDIGSRYTKAVIFGGEGQVLARAVRLTGFRLARVAEEVMQDCMAQAGLARDEVAYVVTTGIGRHQAEDKDVAVTDLTAAARGAAWFFPGTRTVLDIGGQTMKASRIDAQARVIAFRLNDKCAAGTGAFLEKTAMYMGYAVDEIGSVLDSARTAVPISGVCAVFAESEVINHLSQGTPPGDIMFGAIQSLSTRTVQLLRLVKAEPEYTLIGGILNFKTMASTLQAALGQPVQVPPDGWCMYAAALGAALLGQQRLRKRAVMPEPQFEARV